VAFGSTQGDKGADRGKGAKRAKRATLPIREEAEINEGTHVTEGGSLAERGVRGVLDSKYNLGRIEEQGLNLGTGRELVIHAISQHDFLLVYFVYLVHPIYFHIHNIFYPYGFHSKLWDLWTKG
jgi:hypothetical protein